MFFLVKNVFSKNLFHKARNEIIENKKFLYEDYSKYADRKIFRIRHDKLIQLTSVMNLMLSEKITSFLKKKFRKVFLINLFYSTINSYHFESHRDGQSWGYSKKSLEMSNKIFKIVIYLNNYKSDIIDLSLHPSTFIKFFKNEKLSKTINYYYDYYIKKNFFFKNSGYKDCDALIFDNNTWHKSRYNKIYQNFDENNIHKIYLAYEVVVDDIDIAREYSSFLSKKYNINTKFFNDLNSLNKSKLKMFDEIVDIQDKYIT